MDYIATIMASMAPLKRLGGGEFQTVRTIGEINGVVYGITGVDGVNAFRKLIDTIYKTKRVRANYALSDVVRVVSGHILAIIGKSIPTDRQFKSDVLGSLPQGPNKIYEIWRHIYGVKFRRFRKLGGFTFQKTPNMKKKFSTSKNTRINWEEIFGEFVVKVNANCVSSSRSVEMADELYRRLEMLFACLIGDGRSGYVVRVIRPTAANLKSYAAIVDGQNETLGSSNHGVEHKTVDLDSEFFRDPAIPRLFDLISKQNCSSVEKRIVRAIDWIGKGTISNSQPEAMICYCTALEALLVREKKMIISPSIVASLSEFCAYLLATGYAQRRHVEKLVKSVYGERSAVAHGGSVEVDLELLAAARSLAFELVVVLSKRSKAGMLEDSHLVEFIAKEKYGT